MKRPYAVYYRVDTGYDWVSDCALVFAENENEVVRKINEHVNLIGYEYMIDKITVIHKFSGDVFTGRYGWS